MPTAGDPAYMTPEERAAEVASILAAGVLRQQNRGARPNGQNAAENRDQGISENSPELPWAVSRNEP